jgi:hypothetical protein
MEEFAKELEMWSTPADPARGPASVEDLIARVHAITAPAVAAAQERTDLRREASALAGRLRAAHNTLRPTMERLGRVFPPSNGEEGGGLILQGLGGKSGRRDVAATWSESLTLVPPSPQHKVGLTVDVAWELFETWDIHLVVGMYLRSGADLPEVFMLETRDARVGTEHASRTADSLAQMVVDSFAAAANRYADLLDAEEARIQSSRQPRLESAGTNYTFQTQPEAGVITIIRRADGSVDGHAIAWLGAPLTEIRADGDRLFVRAGDKQGWIEQNSAQNWVLAPLRPTDSEGEVPEHPNSETSCRGG